MKFTLPIPIAAGLHCPYGLSVPAEDRSAQLLARGLPKTSPMDSPTFPFAQINLASMSPMIGTFKIVGPQRRIDEREPPHPRVDGGELGERLRQWRKDNAGGDVFRRIFGAGGGDTGPNNCLRSIMAKVPEGKVNPTQIPVADPARMARNIKEIARFLGATVVWGYPISTTALC